MIADDSVVEATVEMNEGDLLVAENAITTIRPAPTQMGRSFARLALANWTNEERVISFRFTKDGIETVNQKGRGRTKWSAVHRFIESPQSFIYYSNEVIGLVIPKRAFTEDQLAMLRTMFAEWVTPRSTSPAGPRKLSLQIRILILWVVLVGVAAVVFWLFLPPEAR